MKSKTILIAVFGVSLIAAHIAVNAFIMEGSWKIFHVYWIDPTILLLSGLVIFLSYRARKKDHTRTGLTYSFMSIAKLLGIAVIALIMSKQLLDDQKMPFAVHFLAPALVFIVLELIIVKGYISEDEKNIKNQSP